MEKFVEKYQVCQGFLPVDMAGGANAGDWVGARDYDSIVVVLFKEPGAAAEIPVLTFEQATAAAGTGAKALLITEFHTKKAATDLLAVPAYTKVTQTASGTVTDTAGTGDQAGIYIFEIASDMLDTNGGFNFIRVSVADTGTTAGQFGAMLYIGRKPRYIGESLPTMLS